MIVHIEYNHYMARKAFQDVIAAAARLQELFGDAVLVGGTAAAQHAGHRVSLDADHELADLRQRFDQVLEALEITDGWLTARVKRPVMILGSLDGVETGIRQLIRQRPLEVQEVQVDSRVLRIPTIEEMLRIKAWLILRRNATRDYLDFSALADRLGAKESALVIARIDDYYEDQMGRGGSRVATQVAKQLAEPAPYDLAEVDLARYRDLVPRWRKWASVEAACQEVVFELVELQAAPQPGQAEAGLEAGPEAGLEE